MTREEAIKIIERVDICANAAETARNMAIAALKEPEIVRCKDCRLWIRNGGFTKAPTGHCFCHDIVTTAHDFCSYGGRGK